MNNRRDLQPAELNRHALAFIQNVGTVTLAFVATLILLWIGGF